MDIQKPRKPFFPTTPTTRLTLLVAVIEAILVVALESAVGAMIIGDLRTQGKDPFNHNDGKGVPVYIFIFIFAMAWLTWAAWDGIRHQNTIQIIGFVLFNFCCLVYSIFQLFQLSVTEPTDVDTRRHIPLLVAIPVVIGLSAIAYLALAAKLYMEFGWKIYKRIGADVKMKEMYRAYQIFVMLVKVDVFFFFGFSVQFLVLVLEFRDVEFPLTIFALCSTVVVLGMSLYGIRKESRLIMGLFIGGLFLGMGYFIFKLVRMYSPSQSGKYANTRNFLTFFAAVSLSVLCLTIAQSIICYRNFDKGLKRFVDGSMSAANGKQKLPFFTLGRGRRDTNEAEGSDYAAGTLHHNDTQQAPNVEGNRNMTLVDD